VLRRLDAEVVEVRLPHDLDIVKGLIVPGGESTTIARLVDIYGLRAPILRKVAEGMALWGTCAGMILMASSLSDDRPKPWGLLPIQVARNAFGRQVDSFEADLEVGAFRNGRPFRAVFIRAPVVTEVGEGVEVLARLADGRPVAVKQGRLLATAFHPELTRDTRFHSYFISLAEGAD
jgi:5'-phosphate synthase pdxT subunit